MRLVVWRVALLNISYRMCNICKISTLLRVHTHACVRILLHAALIPSVAGEIYGANVEQACSALRALYTHDPCAAAAAAAGRFDFGGGRI